MTFVCVIIDDLENTKEPEMRDESLGLVEGVIDALLEDDVPIDADNKLDFVDSIVAVGESVAIEGLAEFVKFDENVGVAVCTAVLHEEIVDFIDNCPDAESESILDTESCSEFVDKIVVLAAILAVCISVEIDVPERDTIVVSDDRVDALGKDVTLADFDTRALPDKD